ncbi:MAG: EamA family transporter [Propioniciclava sp.]|uniref:EamA family transporter n=1 Tax=Propioniciclava sp. TaxID=2038686 RepID=UPI0039E25173
MWIVFALGAAFFAGLTSILAKVGIAHAPSHLATALRTIVVLACAWGMVFVVGSQAGLGAIGPRAWLFLGLSGLATGGSWLCFFRALQLGEAGTVAAVDKSSIVLTVLFAIVFLGETDHLLTRLAGMVLIVAGTWFMVERSAWSGVARGGSWLPWAFGSAGFAALTAILGKVGITEVESSLGTAIRTVVVLVMAWVVVFITGEQRVLRAIPRRDLAFIAASGVATGASWLCYWRAMQEGPASLVAPIDRLSILVTVGFAAVVLGERLPRRAASGLALIVAGTLGMLI